MAWTNWPPRNSGRLVVEQDDGDVVVDRQAAVLERDQVVRIGRPRPGVDAPWAGSRSGPRARLASGRRRPRRARARRARARCRGTPATSGGTRRGWRSGRRSGRREPSCARLSHGESAATGGVPVPLRRRPRIRATVRGDRRVLGNDGYRQPAHRRARRRRRRIVRGPRAGPPGPALLDRPARARRPARRRGGRPGRLRPCLPGAVRVRPGTDPRAPAPAVAGHDRAQPVSLAADPTAGQRPAIALSLDAPAAGRSRASHRRGARTGRHERGPRRGGRLGRPAADPAAGLSQRGRAAPRRRAVATRSSPPPSIDPRAPSRPRSTAAWPCCARRSRPPSGASARR